MCQMLPGALSFDEANDDRNRGSRAMRPSRRRSALDAALWKQGIASWWIRPGAVALEPKLGAWGFGDASFIDGDDRMQQTYPSAWKRRGRGEPFGYRGVIANWIFVALGVSG